MSKWENEGGTEFDPATGAIKNFICYGDGDDAAVYSRRCGCGRFVKPEPTARVNEIVNEAFGNCSRCGRVELAFICWAGDAR